MGLGVISEYLDCHCHQYQLIPCVPAWVFFLSCIIVTEYVINVVALIIFAIISSVINFP